MPENLEIKIEAATLLDLTPVMALLFQMRDEGGQMVDETDWRKVAHTVTEQITQGLVFVARIESGVIGSLGLVQSSEWYSTETVVGDLWFFVLPDFRKSKAAFQLMKHVSKLAKDNNKKLKVGHVLGYNVDKMDKFYGKLGFERTGTMYRMK